MRVLFLHHNFPGQYKHLAVALARQGHTVYALGDADNVGAERRAAGVRIFTYETPRGATPSTHHYLRHFEAQVRRGQAVVRRLMTLRRQGLALDVICVHPGWGEALFLRDVFPDVPQLHYAEFYYNARDSDVGFDPEYPATLDDRFRVRVKNAALNLSATEADWLVSPTRWQAAQLPPAFRSKTTVVHDGIATDKVKPDPDARLVTDSGAVFSRGDEVVTYVARNLEPYRGVHTLLRALPRLQRLRPDAHVLLVGGDGVSYGRPLREGLTYRERYLDEVRGELDLKRVHFLGKLGYADYLRLLQVSAVHVYLTYPFVLSWSALEAMAAGCALVASDTAPVREAVEHGATGRLVDFFDPEAVAEQVADLLVDRGRADQLGRAARQRVVERYDLKRVCLPRHIDLVTRLAEQVRSSAA